jgi:hypothetical protein
MKPVFFDGEFELAKRCGIEDVYAGDTNTDSRRERVRAACLERDPAIAWRGPTGKPETYGEAFARTYGEPL